MKKDRDVKNSIEKPCINSASHLKKSKKIHEMHHPWNGIVNQKRFDCDISNLKQLLLGLIKLTSP